MLDIQCCHICPHDCKVNRHDKLAGYCRSGSLCSVASICAHTGEEPAISGEKGICNVFFAGCNMQCVYCQNHEISHNTDIALYKQMTPQEVACQIIEMLPHCENRVGFVSPTHYVPQVIETIDYIRFFGANPVFVYNSNGYELPETLKLLDGKIDVYLPDFKYSDASLGKKLSGVANYPDIAIKAIKEMYRQKISLLLQDDESGLAESGLIIRHLVLPGFIEQSIEALRLIAENISTAVHISLMSQYYPPYEIAGFPSLNRTLHKDEYKQVVDALYQLGFHKGWVQELASAYHYRPHFFGEHPFI